LSALGGLQRCPGCGLPEFGCLAGLRGALPGLAGTGAGRIVDLGGGFIDGVGWYDVFGTEVPGAGLQRFFGLG